MKIGELMSREVVTCRLDKTLETAANLFWSHDLGVLPIVDSRNRVVGLLTDRDVCLGAFFRGCALSEIPVSDSMSSTVESCLSSDDIETAARKMAAARVRRLPVIDATGRLEGIIGLADLARAMVAQKTGAKLYTETLCAITAKPAAKAGSGSDRTAQDSAGKSKSAKTRSVAKAPAEPASKPAAKKTGRVAAKTPAKTATKKVAKPSTTSKPKAKAKAKTKTNTKNRPRKA